MVQPDQPSAVSTTRWPAKINRTVWIVVAAVVAFVLVAALLTYLVRPSGDQPGTAAGDREATGARDGREQASVVLLDGATSVTVRSADLGDRLYHVTTPAGGEHLPVVTVVDDEVRIELTGSGEHGSSAVDIRLHSQVQWQIRLVGGATEQAVDLGDGRVSEVELAGGAARIELTLPPPEGTIAVRMTGGVEDWRVHQVGEAPVRVQVNSGAGSVTIDGQREAGIAAGTVFAPPGWDGAEHRVDIDAVAGMATLVVDRRSADAG